MDKFNFWPFFKFKLQIEEAKDQLWYNIINAILKSNGISKLKFSFLADGRQLICRGVGVLVADDDDVSKIRTPRGQTGGSH